MRLYDKLENLSQYQRWVLVIGCTLPAMGASYIALQHAGDVLQAAGTDAVGALLVFLNLLEGDAEVLTELFLTHPEHHAAQSNPAPDVDIDRVWLLLVRHSSAASLSPDVRKTLTRRHGKSVTTAAS